MDTLSIKEAADLWCLSEQMVRRYCKEGKIEGAVRVGRSWVIPADTKYIDQQEIVLTKSTPKLASQIIKQKNYKKAFHGLYDYLQIYMTYSSCRMASCRLTMDHIDMIFRKGKVVSRFEPLKVSDLIEALNHFACIDYVLDHLMEPLTQRYIKKLHSLLVMGTVDERKERVVAGRYRPEGYTIKDRTLIPAQLVPDELDRIIKEYEDVQHPEISDVLNFHVEFEILAPFRDYNGRLGRLVMLKECLRHSITPFVLDDKRRGDYLDGIKKWSGRRKLLIGVVAEAQERFESAIERQELRRYGLEYEPPGYSNHYDNHGNKIGASTRNFSGGQSHYGSEKNSNIKPNYAKNTSTYSSRGRIGNIIDELLVLFAVAGFILFVLGVLLRWEDNLWYFLLFIVSFVLFVIRNK